ncbi:TerB family tellurite resistance protein [Maribacter thermophilus]|uniref:TerB family tellurite resistance protein n=1 Tax=Maribacter thermophilus TaxID=1197874 RepID=UPI000699AF2D|nr:TerB family tellurite resistance protein [Maribacter thermophilus]
MDCKKERLQIISGMLASAAVDGTIKQSEHDFLLKVGRHLEVSEKEFNSLLKENRIYVLPASISERIIKFYRFVLSYYDQGKKIDYKNIRKLYQKGVEMGLSPKSVRKTLYNIYKSSQSNMSSNNVNDFLSVN